MTAPDGGDAARAQVRAARGRIGRTLVVLDDDPTGSQCVHGIPVVTAWAHEDLAWAFAQPGGGFFVLTNTRSLGPDAAAARVAEIAAAVDAAAAGRPFDLVLRGDSTLRGHFPLESDVLAARAAARAEPYHVLLLVPAYLEAGRATIDDVHLVRTAAGWRPVGETDYAADATFGYRSSDLGDYIAEKTRGAIPRERVGSISLELIRSGGAERVRDAILAAVDSFDGVLTRPIVVNAERAGDLDVAALGVLMAQAAGARVLVRTGPSFVAALLGLDPRPPLARADAFATARRPGHGLVVAGSHVALTTAQLRRLRAARPDMPVVDLDVPLLVGKGADAEVKRCVTALTSALRDADALLVTSRRRVEAEAPEASLALARTVSEAIVAIVAAAVRAVPVSWVIAKGGITSSDVATGALGIRRATVLGQLFPGTVSVWAQRDSGADGLAYVVFAGNVGDEEALADAVALLSDAAT